MDADNLAANFSRELADYIIYIIDVSAGDKIPRKGGPGITQADLLVFDFIVCCIALNLLIFVRDVSSFRSKIGNSNTNS